MINYFLDQLRVQKKRDSGLDNIENEEKRNKISSEIEEHVYRDAAEMLFDLSMRKSTAALIEGKYGVKGQILSRCVARKTVLFLTFAYVFVGIISIILPLNNLSIILLLIFALIPVISWWILPHIIEMRIRNSYKKLKINWGYDAQIEWIINHLKDNAGDKYNWLLWWQSVTMSPFSIKSLWVWVIIIGIYSTFLKADQAIITRNTIRLIEIIELYGLGGFFLEVLRIMILSIVTYIATNIITDLLDLKDEYVKGKDEISEKTDTLSKIVSDISAKITSSNRLMDNIVGEIRQKKFFLPLQKGYEQFIKNKANKYPSSNDSILSSFEEYSERLASQVDLLAENLTGNSVIDLWTLAGMKSAERLRVEQISERKTIITSFDLFGNIIADCLDGIGVEELKKTEIYTVFSLPPDHFLNYTDKDEGKFSKYWEKYLEKNINAVNNDIKIHRHFLSFINSEDKINNNYGSEKNDLRYDVVRKKLDDLYYVDDLGMPCFSDGKYLKKEPENGNNTNVQPLRRILANKYHCSECCKLIKADLRESCKDVIYSTKYKKPIDYFALLSKSDNEWLFCFKAYYDNDIKVAIVEFWHRNENKSDEWEEIKNELNKLFCNDGTSGISIEIIS